MNLIGVRPALPGISGSKKLGFFSFNGGNQPINFKPGGVYQIKVAVEEKQTLKLDVKGKVDRFANGHAGNFFIGFNFCFI